MEHLQILCELLKDKFHSEELKTQLKEFTTDDWDIFLDLSASHDIQAILYQPMKTLSKEITIPGAVIEQLYEMCLKKAARNTVLLNEAKEILSAFNDNEIPVICLKGLYLGEKVYQNIFSRSMGDLDLLLKKRDIPKALSILESLGYQSTTYFDHNDKNLDVKHVPPFKNKKGAFIEIHWTILAEDEPFQIDIDGIWTRAIPVTIAGVNTTAMSLEDLILHLAIHLTYQHYLRIGLRGLFDIALVIKNNQNLVDWSTLSDRAENWGATRTLNLTFQLLKEILSVQIPKFPVAGYLDQPIKTDIISQAKDQLLNKTQYSFVVTPDLAKLSAKRGWMAKIKIVLSRIFLPKSTMARLYAVAPKSLMIYLYYPVRFYELLRYHASSAFRILIGREQALSRSSRVNLMENLKNWLGHQE
jgi:hypothetical protein